MNRLHTFYREVIRCPGSTDVIQVFADLLEEAGHVDLAAAYRWAAEHDKWPCVLHQVRYKGEPNSRRDRPVYDWDKEGREFPFIPPTARLPKELYLAIHGIPNRKYGGVNRAFILLAGALKKVKR